MAWFLSPEGSRTPTHSGSQASQYETASEGHSGEDGARYHNPGTSQPGNPGPQGLGSSPRGTPMPIPNHFRTPDIIYRMGTPNRDLARIPEYQGWEAGQPSGSAQLQDEFYQGNDASRGSGDPDQQPLQPPCESPYQSPPSTFSDRVYQHPKFQGQPQCCLPRQSTVTCWELEIQEVGKINS